MESYNIDACSLIYLTKINFKERLLKNLKIIITNTVKCELLADLSKYQDAKIINSNIVAQKIEIKDIENVSTKLNFLGKGEAESIENALRNKYPLICDDIQAIKYAKKQDLTVITTEIVLLNFLRSKWITDNEFSTFFHQLARIKSLNPEIIDYIKQKSEELPNKGAEG